MRHPSVLSNIKILILILAMAEIVVATVQIEEKFRMSSKRAYFSTIEVDKKIYFVGGYENNDFIASNAIDVFDLVTGNWSDLPINLTTARGRISTTVIGDRIYMVGGHEYTSIPSEYSTAQKDFTSVGFTSGPTVRRPIRLSLHNSTLTVIGYFSVDFMDTNTKRWTHNEKLTTDVMFQLFNMTTIAHHNFVFVIGGINITTQLPSTSIWMINSTSAEPFEFQNVLLPTSGSFVGSWFDEDHGAVVVNFDSLCLVYHASTQKWRQRTTTSRSVTSVTYQNSTIVFFSDGFWTIDWQFMNDTWTQRTQINFAFTIGDQLVYSAANEMSILTPATSETQTVDVGPAALSIAFNSSMYFIANTTGGIFGYNSNTKKLVLISDPNLFTPVRIFRSNNSVYIAGLYNGTDPYVISVDAAGIPVTQKLVWIPDVLIENFFFNFERGLAVDVQYTTHQIVSTSKQQPLWVQQGDVCFVLNTAPLNDNPLDFNSYNAIDVYNYVNNTWEQPILLPESTYVPHQYYATFVLNETLSIYLTGGTTGVIQPNNTGGWTTHTLNGLAPLTHPTYTPLPVINNVAYSGLRTNIGIKIIPSTFSVQTSTTQVLGQPLQTLASNNKIILPVTKSLLFTDVAIYDIASGTWTGPSLQTHDNMVSLAMYDNWILAFGDNMDYFSYMDITELHWAQQPFNNSFVPASIFVLSTRSATNQTRLVIAGGYHRLGGYYTDEVLMITLDLPLPNVTETEQPQSTLLAAPADQPNNGGDSNMIIIAVVVPIGAVAIAGGILAVILIRRKNQRKRSAKVIAVGLEQQFGQWFVPFNDLQFGTQLGQGANGQVFKGKWKNTDVALKTSMTQASQSIASELTLMINMRPHPNVVQLFGFSVHPETNSIILILEYCNGGSLDALLCDQNSPINPNTKLYWLKSICKGISHLHANNLVHRDIAARNVLLHQGEPKLTDFGMTRLVDEEQQRGTTKSELGPIRWMAPESLRAKEYSTKSDVWSFGILMYEILAQQEPHVNEDPIEVGRKIRDEGLTPQLPSSLECFSDFSSLLNQCCVLDPNYRLTIEKALEKLDQIPL